MADLKLVIVREDINQYNGLVFGKLFANGLLTCNSCENGGEMIPAGTYDVGITFSNHFQQPLPQLFDVPELHSIRLYGGTYESGAYGCIHLGRVRTDNGLAKCCDSINRVIEMIEDCEDSGFQVTLEIA